MFCLPVLRSNLVLEIFAHFLVTFIFFLMFCSSSLCSSRGRVQYLLMFRPSELRGRVAHVLSFCALLVSNMSLGFTAHGSPVEGFAHISSFCDSLLMFRPSKEFCSCSVLLLFARALMFLTRVSSLGERGKRGRGCSSFVLRNFDHVYNSTIANVPPASSSLLFHP